MSDEKQWYAACNKERNSFVVEKAGWEENKPIIEYRFRFVIDPRTGRKLGGIDKIWMDNGYEWSDFYAYKGYLSKRAFDEDVASMMKEAQHLAHIKKRDYFMCVLDLVKIRAVKTRREYATIKYYDELFDVGPIDAYRWLIRS